VASQYELEYEHSGGTFGANVNQTQIAQLRCPARSAKPSEDVRFGERSAAGASTDVKTRATSRRVASVEFDADDVGFENVFTTEAAHGLKIGDWIYVVYDADVDLTAAYATNGTNADVDSVWMQVVTVPSTTSVTTAAVGSGDTDDAVDAALDGNLWAVDSDAVQIAFEKTVRSITLADGAQGSFPVALASLALCEDLWDGEIEIQVPASDVSETFVVDAGTPNPKSGVGATQATGTITFSGLPGDREAIRIGDSIYYFDVTTLNDVPGQVFAVTDATTCGDNLAAAINNTATEGTDYGTGTGKNAQVTASNAAGVVTITAIQPGAIGNTIAIGPAHMEVEGADSGVANVAFSADTLTGGAGYQADTSVITWDDDYTDGDVGLREHTDNVVYLYNESGAALVFDVIMKNSPFVGDLKDAAESTGIVIVDNELWIMNRTGASQTYKIRRTA
jgi:hypothetical protein